MVDLQVAVMSLSVFTMLGLMSLTGFPNFRAVRELVFEGKDPIYTVSGLLTTLATVVAMGLSTVFFIVAICKYLNQ